jgi:hypothetical protein
MDRTHLADMLGMPTTKLTFELLEYCTKHEMPMFSTTVPLLVAEDLIMQHADPRDTARLIEEARQWEATADARGKEIEADPYLSQAQVDALWSTFRRAPEMVSVRLIAPDGKVYDLPDVDRRGLNLLMDLYPQFTLQYKEA